MKNRQKDRNKTNTEAKKQPEVPEAPYVSIDFGTSFLMASYINNEKIEIITNEDGHRTTPAYVSFTETEVLVGDIARAQLYRNPKNTVYDIKKLIGKTYDQVKHYLADWEFEVKNDNGYPVISIAATEKERLYTPVEIAAILYERMKQTAETATGVSITKVVITIPSSFSEAQSKALLEAVRMAGMEPVKILGESIATVLSYGFDDISGEKNILDFHFGGGSFDLILVRSVDGILDVVGQYSNPNVRGIDFHKRILNLCIQEFKKQTGIDITNNKKAIKKLELICEAAKVVLSTATSVPIEADSLAEGLDFSMTLYRPKYEAICSDLFPMIIPAIEKLLGQFNLSKAQIDEVIIEGGISKTPKIYEMLKAYFDKEPRNQINPDELVVYGGAIQIMNLSQPICVQGSMTAHTICYPLSLELPVGQTKVVVPVGSPIPLRKIIKLKVKKPIYLEKDKGMKNYTTPIFIYQGDNELASKCKLIANVSLAYECDVLNQIEGLLQIDLVIEVFEDGVMKFTAIDRLHNKKNTVTLSHFDEIPHVDVKEQEKVPEEILEALNKLKELKNYCYSVAIIVRKLSISEELKKKFYANNTEKTLSWIAGKIYDPKIESSVIAETQERRKNLENEFKELLKTNLS